ncbi:hypothetical protein FJW01_05530 [Pantoea deleyi]|uniref:Uncharacterized protein n=1 Tax=Pantoea deleyi TaxID=470932 RepID=A0A506QIZ3_9GAMM|nr:hypothetical protein FJW01_05530 [Pantoea deleyi]
MASRCWKNWRFSGFSLKKTALGILFEISACQPPRTPYNAPPLTRHNGLRSAGLSRFEIIRTSELSENKCLTDNAESVIYAARAAVNRGMLFNNLSDNLCGHSQD